MFTLFKSNFINIVNKNRLIIKYGVITNTAIGIALRGLGDIIQQTIEINHHNKKLKLNKPTQTDDSIHSGPIIVHIDHESKNYDWIRTSFNRFFIY